MTVPPSKIWMQPEIEGSIVYVLGLGFVLDCTSAADTLKLGKLVDCTVAKSFSYVMITLT